MATDTGTLRPSEASAGSNKLVYLEMGRALAALIVVFHHADQATAYFLDVARTRITWSTVL